MSGGDNGMDRSSPTPLYRQLAAVLQGEIRAGRLRSGQRLATEFELMRRFAVSRTTVRQTIAHLQKNGLVSVQRGKGTFVGKAKIEPELSALTGFVEDMLALGLTPSARLLSIQEIGAPAAVATELRIEARHPVTKITRVRLADQVPVSFEYSFLPLDLGRRVAEENLEIHPIFFLLEDKYGIPLGEAAYRIEAGRAGSAAAQALGIERGAPILAIERTTFSAAGEPVDFEQMFYRGDKIRYTMRLQRRRPAP